MRIALGAVIVESAHAQFSYGSSIPEHRRDSVATLLETTIVLESRSGPASGYELDAFLQEAGIELEPVTAEHAQAARRAWRRFGKGNHPAGLNFGDCFAYALAAVTGEPLLYKGEDFALTDVEAA